MQQFLGWGICPYILYPNGNVECIYEDIRFPNLYDELGMYNALMEALTETKSSVRIKIHDPRSTRFISST
jgi:hypothetical protein